MLNLGDVVRVKESTIPVLCQIIDISKDELSTLVQYKVEAIEFRGIIREFTEDQLEKIY